MHRLAVMVFFVVISVPLQFAQSAEGQLAITNVTVIDVESGNRLINQTVVIAGNQITAVGPSTQVSAPAGARIVSGQGKFLIPGLWDMHVHSLEHMGVDYGTGMEPYKLYLANGVTGVRDMGSSYVQLVAGRRRIESQNLLAPRIIASGPLLEGGQPPLNRALISKYVPTPEAGRLAVDTLTEAGVDFLKVHNGLSRETYFSIADEAKRKNMVFAGHVPNEVTFAEASDAGQRSIEHLASLMATCDDPSARKGAGTTSNQPIEIHREKCEDAIRHAARNGTWLTPTVISSFPQTSANTPDFSAQMRYVKPAKRATCAPLPVEERAGARAGYELSRRLVRMAADGGLRMLAGTDTGGCRLPGFALQRELALLVEAGLSPVAALRTATIYPAIYFNMGDTLGTIARGKLADLVLLDADPLADIHNTQRIFAIVANGRLVEPQKLLDDVLASARGNN